MRDKAETLMQLLQLDAWEARNACIHSGVVTPNAHRSEGEGFHGRTPTELKALRHRLESENDACTAELLTQGMTKGSN